MQITEPNNIIDNANDSGLNSPGDSVVLSGEIESTSDVDIVGFEVETGDVLTLNVEAVENVSQLDSVVRIFDSAGNEVTFNDDGAGPFESYSLDSYLAYTSNVAGGEYYVGVSGYANFSYDPDIEDSGDGSSTGEYDLAASIFNGVPGTDSSDRLSGGGESDYIQGLSGNDSLYGGPQKDSVLGDAGNDFVVGGSGDDLLQGGDGNDVLRSDSDNDTLGGGLGNDSLYGGRGDDLFVIGDGRDKIFDFADQSDQILLANGLTFDSLSITASTSGGTGTTISNSDGNIIAELTGVDPSLITSEDFSFTEAVSSSFRFADPATDK